MSPFSDLLHKTRLRNKLRQAELASLTGRDQTYISALETNSKGPPSAEFVEKVVKALSLTKAEAEHMSEAASASERKLVLDRDTPLAVYWLVHRLRYALPKLQPIQVRLIDEILSLHASRDTWPEPARRVRRRQREGAKM